MEKTSQGLILQCPQAGGRRRTVESERLETRMLLQSHDELLFESPQVDRVSALVREEEDVHLLDVPLVVDVSVGDNWTEAH